MMMKTRLLTLALFLFTAALHAQNVGIGVDTPQTTLHVAGTMMADSMKLPTGAMDGYILVSDSAGVMLWVHPDSVATKDDGDWAWLVDTLYNITAARIGIGTASPQAKLDVNGKIRMQDGATDGFIPVSNAEGVMTWTDPTTITTAPDSDSDPTNEKSNLNLNTDILTLTNPLTGGNQVDLSSYKDNTDDWDNAGSDIHFLIGDVGIGTNTPAERLDVNGQIRMQNGASNGYLPVSDANGTMTWTDPTTITTAPDGDGDSSNEKSDLNLNTDILTLTNPLTGGNQVDLSGYLDNTDDWNNAGSDIHYTTGRVGVGTTTPAATIDISGTMMADSIKLVTGATSGFIPVSDANGVMTWTDPATVVTAPDGDGDSSNEKSDLNLNTDILTLTNPLTGGNQIDLSSYLDNTDDWNNSGPDIHFASGKVGVGTTSPAATIDVSGMMKSDSIKLVTGATSGFIPVSNVDGVMTWTDPDSIATKGVDLISDADADTKIEAEQSSDEDTLRFTVDGVEIMTLDSRGLQLNDSLDNVLIGKGVAPGIIPGGVKNTMVGPQTGANNTNGRHNTFVGFEAGRENTTSDNNTFVGYQSGRDNTASHNTFMGFAAGRNNTTGYHNSMFGFLSGDSTTTGFDNTLMGYKAGWRNSTGIGNTFIGRQAGSSSISGNHNTFIGNVAGYYNTTGTRNTYVGTAAGLNVRGNNNIILGADSGPGSLDTFSQRLMIDVGFSDHPLIYGEFDNDKVAVHGNLDVHRGNTFSTARTLTLSGARTGPGNAFARIDFQNIDTDGDSLEYVGATIKSHNSLLTNSGDLRFMTKDSISNVQERLRITPNGNVGIGSANPSEPLDVNGQIRMRSGGNTGYIPMSDADGVMTWTDPSTIMTQADGDWEVSNDTLYNATANRVGIGTAAPEVKFHITGGTDVKVATPTGFIQAGDHGGLNIGIDNNEIMARNNGTVSDLFLNMDGGDVLISSSGTGNVGIGDASPDGKLEVRQTGTADIFNLYDNFSNVFTVRDGGNVGIGTTAPGAKLHVEGTIEVDQKIQANDAGGLELATDEGTTRLHIQDDGKVRIGTGGDHLTNIITHSETIDLPNIAGNTNHEENITVTGATTSSTVMVSPGNDLDGGMVISFARVTAANNVRIKWRNTGGSGQNEPNNTYRVTVINH